MSENKVFKETKDYIESIIKRERQLETEIQIRTKELNELREKKVQLILLIANQNIYESIFGKIDTKEEKKCLV